MSILLLPSRACYLPKENIIIETRGKLPIGAEILVRHLGKIIHRQETKIDSFQIIPPLPVGGHGIELVTETVIARTAVEVTTDLGSRLRYGFVANFNPGKDIQAVTDLARRLHLNGIQFYDWAYRHADLLGGGEEYQDALGQNINLKTVRELVSALRSIGTVSYGYGAVYAVGNDEWEHWQNYALLTASGIPYTLSDFLSLIDPATPEWLTHFTEELRKTVEKIGFEGFHLDQYGYPKYAATYNSNFVDLADSFATLIDTIRQKLPDTKLIFNNVNNFPTWRSAKTPQDAIYIEPWHPTTTLESLANIVSRARAIAPEKPVVISAYQSVYRDHPAELADPAAQLTMATLFSHGATQLLAGEDGKILIDPYYVKNHQASQKTLAMLTRWYDFLIEHDELLYYSNNVDVTLSYVGDYNNIMDISYQNVQVTENPVANSVWRRIVQTQNGFLIHLINLVGQHDTLWDSPRNKPEDIGYGKLRFEHIWQRKPKIRIADPDKFPYMKDVEYHIDGNYIFAQLPAPHVWQVVHVTL